MGRKAIDLTGLRFGKLVVIERAGNNSHKAAMWMCKCDCGNTKIVCGSKLLEGEYKSCGCSHHDFNPLRNEGIRRSKIKHNLSGNRLYYIYDNMTRRCYDPNSEKYCNYGARGITVCDEWKNDRCKFFDWALSNGYSEDLTIDRIDVNGNYCPENCKWSTQKEQANNRTSNKIIEYGGERHTVSEWSDITGIKASTLYRRFSDGWDVERALTKK